MYRFAEHVGELELELEGSSREALFADALAALNELVGNDESGESVVRTVHAAAADDAALLGAWLEELLFLVETEDLVPERVEQLVLSDGQLEATIRGLRGRPRHLVKAVTYHDLAFAPVGERWSARVVLDV